MDRLHFLERALWEAHKREASVAALVETRKLQGAHKVERETLVANLQHRRHHLQQSCRTQVRILRQEHESRFPNLERAVPPVVAQDGGEEFPGSDVEDPTTLAPSPTQDTAAMLESASRASGTAVAETSHSDRREIDTTTEAIAAPGGEKGDGDGLGGIDNERHVSSDAEQAVSNTAVVPAALPGGSSRVNKALVELRSELRRHLTAVAHVLDGDQHLREATRVMRQIHKVEQDRLEAEAKVWGELVTDPERMLVQQKQEQAEEIQRDKHERLRRSLERSGKEELRLLSARHKGALGRLAVRCRAAKQTREIALRGELAKVKGGVARLWREHNRSSCGYGPGSNGNNGACEGSGGARKGERGRGCCPSQPHQQEGITRATTQGSITAVDPRGEEGYAGTVGEDKEADRGREKEGEGEGYGTDFGDGNLSRLGRGESDNGKMSQQETARAAGSIADEQAIEGDETAAPSSLALASENDKKQHEKTRPASVLRSAASSGRKHSSYRTGTPWRRKKRSPTTPAVATESSATANVADTSLGDGSFGVLSEGEARALAALGRGAPNDPRLLLSAFPLPPPWRRLRPEASSLTHLDEQRRIESESESEIVWNTGVATAENSDGYGGDGGEIGRRSVVEREMCPSTELEVLDRAMEKLAKKIRAEEDWSRRELGMAPLSTQ
eukprot:g6744.t1